MKTKSQIGQEIRWVAKYNRAIDRAFRHWGEPLAGTISNIRAFKRHFRQACKIERNRGLTIIDTAAIPPEDSTHHEPEYNQPVDSLTHFCDYEDSLKSNK